MDVGANQKGRCSTLAESKNIIIQHEYELVELEFKKKLGFKKRSVIIGDFNGDPQCAMISGDESYCAVGGCGMIIYWIKNPLKEYDYLERQNDQYQEYFRDPNNTWWIDTIYQGDEENKIRFVVDPYDEERKGVYEMDVLTGGIEKLI